MNNTIIIGDNWITIENICNIAKQKQKLALNANDYYIEKVNKGSAFLERLLNENGAIYGVTTGYGDSCTSPVPMHLVPELSLHLSRFHGCGLGRFFSAEQVRAIMVTRLTSLAIGMSGVRYSLLKQIELFLEHEIYPLIPEEAR